MPSIDLAPTERPASSPESSINNTPHTNGASPASNGIPSEPAALEPSNGALAAPAPDAVAIVGYGCRLSGHVTSAEDLWELCSRGRSGWSEMPASRFSKDAYHHPNPSKKGCFNPVGGYFLQEDLACFDAPFFNVTAQEARAMDPQQRLLLECAFEALENAGIPKESAAGKDIGVFVGGSFPDYELNNCRDTDTAPMYQATGCANAMMSNRLSYYFDLRGPSVTFDTACSSSLVALHSAMQSIRSGESSAAVVAGCHLNVLPDLFVTMSTQQYVSPDLSTIWRSR